MEIQKPGQQLGEKTVYFIFERRMNHVCEVFTQENPLTKWYDEHRQLPMGTKDLWVSNN